jgi:basic membrane protein A
MKACQVTGIAGVDDKGLNASAWKGVQEAVAQFGVEANLKEPASENDDASAIAAFIDEGCNLIVTVGSETGVGAGDATLEAANANPDVHFSIVDYSYAAGDATSNNVLGQVFNSDEAAFLAGYLAAGTSKTGKVATYGGIAIPPVTDVMTGFYNGVQKYNEDNGAKVEVLGWDPSNPDKGLFAGNFETVADGKDFANTLVDLGADIIMPVAGQVGAGSAAVATTLGPDKLQIIGVDADQYVADEANKGAYLTSVLKNADVTTLNAVSSVVNGSFEGGVTTGTLANGGVGLAPFHDFDALVPQKLKDEIDALSAAIIDGSVTVRAA